MAKPEQISSAANPLVKSVRRAIARGILTEEGLCVAESFHLLEEALRSDCAVKAVLAARSVQSAVETHVRRLQGIRVAVLPDALFRNRQKRILDPRGEEPAAGNVLVKRFRRGWRPHGVRGEPS